MSSSNTTTSNRPEDPFRENRDREPALIKAWQEDHNPRALAELIDNYRPLIRGQIKSILAGRSVNIDHYEDMEQECRLAFIAAVQSFDPKHNASLAAHAAGQIRPALLQYSLTFRSGYKIGRGSAERKAYYAAQRLLAKRAGGDSVKSLNESDIEKISRDTGSSMKATRRAVETVQARQVSLNEEHDNLIEKDHGDTLLSESARERAMIEVRGFLAEITQRNREILMRSFFSEDEPTNADLADQFDVSAERIGQIKRKLLDELHAHLQTAGIEVDDVL